MTDRQEKQILPLREGKQTFPDVSVSNKLIRIFKIIYILKCNFSFNSHSLGAHIAGCAGATVNSSIGVIVGLDPAGPLFHTSETDNRLDPSDAQFVQAIHTCAGRLGYRRSLGTADYRPNGGGNQPGCTLEPTGSCAHGRAFALFAESVRSGG
ncbi:lipase member H-like, partial [Agrilus planipennis]|uniref:Lipase member H-like n=1 Tax=Agrilus planipennis TaxID=224129 RepID=A0A1W4WS10_AGRPL